MTNYEFEYLKKHVVFMLCFQLVLFLACFQIIIGHTFCFVDECVSNELLKLLTSVGAYSSAKDLVIQV